MYLKSLELQGFKSFPDKISLSFDQGFTAVVGPNGSGKSNIGDAVRWVLGEQSTKELRGKSMEDVIFSGTEKRKPMGFAAVTLTIDNADHALSDPEAEVSITRRLYRSGDSEYLINGKSVRLRDINELFMDTGLGRDGYAIIGQGRIAEIVGAKSNERRDIFEEAAGVSKFRYKKQDAERQLSKAQDNMLRLSDIIAELESRLAPLKSQAEKAEKYLVLAAERKTLEVSFWVDRLSRLGVQYQTLSDQYLSLTAEYENLQSDWERANEQWQLAFQDMQQATVDIEKLQNQILNTEQENATVTANIAVCENEILHSKRKIEELKKQVETLTDSGDTSEQRLAEQDAHIQTLEQRQKELALKILAFEQELKLITEQYNQQNERCLSQDSALRRMELRHSEEQARLQGVEKALRDTQEQLRDAEADSSSVVERLQNYEKQVQEGKKRLRAGEVKISEQQNRLAGCKQLAAMKEQKYNQAMERFHAVSSEQQQVQQKARILRELEQSMEGYAGSVQKVLKAAGSGRLGGVHGTVAQRITVEPQYGTAIETALGGALQNLIVENEETAKRCIRYLKEIRGGRGTFLPLTTIKGNRLRENLEDEEGFVALACDLVRYDAVYRNIIESLLGRIVIAEDIDSAAVIAKRYQYRFRIVTLDGQVIHSGGSFSGGSAARSAGVITRTHELAETKEKLKTLSAELEALQADAEKRKAEYAKALTDIEGAQALIEAYQSAQQALQQEMAALEARANSDSAWQENEAAERQRLQEKINQLEGQRNRDSEQLEALAAEIQAAREQLRVDSVKQVRLHSEQEMMTSQIAKERIRNAEQLKDIESERSKRMTMAQSMEQEAERIAALQDEIRAEKQAITQNRQTITTLTEGQDARRTSIQEMKQKIQQLRSEHDKKEQYSVELRKGMDALRDAREKQSGERTRVEERRDAVQREMDDLINRLQDNYELTRTEAEAEAKPIENVREAEAQLSSLRAKIRALGTVNVAAVDEYREVSERYSLMTEQMKDAENAKQKLEKLIEQLTAEMCVIFAESFAKINQYFGEIFVELFGGGSASLELTDPDHILESGIEIKVAPPGKVIKNLISLSGGEQSFVAICIYFAILKLRPAPFCILDEIDAALDEVNVAKFAQYLKRFFGLVQFVVVTHRRSAMDEANVLYGVTMQEDGVSRLLRLDQNGMALTE